MSKRAGSSVVISLLSSDDSGSSSDLSLLHLSEKDGKPAAGPPMFQIPSRSESGSPGRPEALRFEAGWGNDEWGSHARLQWDGVDVSASDSSSVPSMSSSFRSNKKTKSPSPKRKEKSRAIVTSQKRRSKLVKEANLMPLSDEATVNELLKTMITSNEELYLRVLRYEVRSSFNPNPSTAGLTGVGC
jgi:hypothetical protein